MSDPELESFKTDIDLRQYAASLGYELDKRESSRNSSVMRHANGDKIIIKRGGDGHYVFFSVRNDADSGSIIDFIQHRQTINLGAVRKTLRPWIGRAVSSLPLFPNLEVTSKDRLRVESEYRRMKKASRLPYLEHERCLPAALLSSPRFADRVRIDGRGNAIFPHFDQDGICGYEVKNKNFTGFAPGGEKGLWLSRTSPDDKCLVIAESAIDALSYAALFPDEKARYASIGGSLNPTKQPQLIKVSIAKMSEGSEIIAAMDADDAGRELADVVRLAVTEVDRKDLLFNASLPDQEGDDWNQALKNQKGSFPTAQKLEK